MIKVKADKAALAQAGQPLLLEHMREKAQERCQRGI